MSIKIIIPEHLQRKTDGKSSIDVLGDTVRECLVSLVQRYPGLKGEIVDAQGVLLLKWLIFVNEKIASTSDELSHPVKNGDEIIFVPMITGG
jgi:molybdopterin converting factor small subunit